MEHLQAAYDFAAASQVAEPARRRPRDDARRTLAHDVRAAAPEHADGFSPTPTGPPSPPSWRTPTQADIDPTTPQGGRRTTRTRHRTQPSPRTDGPKPAHRPQPRTQYATFDRVRATGPVVLSKCVLTEATFIGCDLDNVVLDACTLQHTEFGPGRYRNLDLRGNTLTTVRGVRHLAKIIIDRAQEGELAQALATELEVTYGDTLDDDR